MGSSTSMMPTVLPASTGACSAPSSDLRPLGFRLIPARSTCTALSIFSPPTFETFSEDDRGRVHHDEEGQQHDDRARGLLDEAALGAVRPQEYLDRQGRRGIRDALGN